MNNEENSNQNYEFNENHLEDTSVVQEHLEENQSLNTEMPNQVSDEVDLSGEKETTMQSQNGAQEKENNINSTKRNNKNKKKKVFICIVVIVLALASLITTILLLTRDKDKTNSTEIKSSTKESEYRLSGNSLEAFDLYFLQLENEEVNKIYSPLSIKYALAMLNEGADGETKKQISAIIGDYKSKKYINSENMSLANVIFIRNTFKDSIKEEYKNILLNKYNAEAILDSFESPDTINNWVKDKTLGLIDNLVDNVSDLDFALINALAIDMEWQQKFLHDNNGSAYYTHEKKSGFDYTYSWYAPDQLKQSSFKDIDEKISGMEIISSINKYDIVAELGEENIRKTVGDAYRKFIKEHPEFSLWHDTDLGKTFGEATEEEINNEIQAYLDSYIEEINRNYKDVSYNTEFSLYVDDDVKVFAKDLKEYNGTTLQYVGIMPINENLNNYISKIDAKSVNSILSNLKELKSENFKDGVVTEIKGYIPKFKFEYSLKLKEDLNKLGVKDIFDSSKANLTNLTSQKGTFIGKIIHKANIEFTQDGIKASAATLEGGLGAASTFDYLYEVPFEEIDLTFDKPYMFLIRDKETGEVWFTGTVYQPLLWNNDQTKTIGY